MADRRRINGPGGVTVPPVFEADSLSTRGRSRPPNGVRAQCRQNLLNILFKHKQVARD